MRSAVCLAFLFVVAIAVAVVSVTAAVVPRGQEPAEPQEQAQEPEEKAEEVPVAEGPLVIPDEEKERKNPFEVDDEFLALGKKLYRSQCRMCHGETGRGEGDLAQEMKLTMPDFTAAATKSKTEGELHYILSKGHGRMPGQGERLRPQQMWSMVTYLRTLTPPKEPAPEQKPKE
jgi:mono/diheme cytochrome c family protein